MGIFCSSPPTGNCFSQLTKVYLNCMAWTSFSPFTMLSLTRGYIVLTIKRVLESYQLGIWLWSSLYCSWHSARPVATLTERGISFSWMLFSFEFEWLRGVVWLIAEAYARLEKLAVTLFSFLQTIPRKLTTKPYERGAEAFSWKSTKRSSSLHKDQRSLKEIHQTVKKGCSAGCAASGSRSIFFFAGSWRRIFSLLHYLFVRSR